MSQIYRQCYHEDSIFLVIYKPLIKLNGEESTESPKLLCKTCCQNPDFVNDSVVEKIINIETEEEIQ